MEFLIGGKQSGKTHELIEWYKKDPDNRVIFVPNVYQEAYIRQTYGYDQIKEDHTFLLSNLNSFRGHSTEYEIGIDNLDDFLRSFFPFNKIGLVTATGSGRLLFVKDNPVLK